MLRHRHLLASLLVLSGLNALARPMGPTGLRPPTGAEQAWMDAHLIRVQQALPNRLARNRVVAERKRRGQPTTAVEALKVAEDGLELSGASVSRSRLLAAPLAAAGDSAMAYPRAVDNSTEDWFPPIGSQLGGSCASFSTTYYTMTSQVARLRGWDVKHSPTSDHLFSTRFIYNQINNGGDNGSWTTAAYDVMLTMGCPSYQTLPYIDGDYVSWPTTASVWRTALNYRMAESGSIPAIDTDAGLAIAKQMLANGYILNYATDIGQWQFTSFKNDPATTADDAFFAAGVAAVKQVVCSYLDNSSGGSGHGMTIVGYNDDLWTDINGNGVVDPGEKGAFRIANSWGDWWQDGGFVWIAYDALKAQSAVTGGPNPTTRVAGFWYNSMYWMSARASYNPSLVAEVTASHAKRNQMSLQVGRGDSTATAPSSTWAPAGLQRSGGALAFDGSTAAASATFVIDCTDLLAAGKGDRWFLSLSDNTAGDPGTLSNLRFIDAGNVATEWTGTLPAGGLPQNADGATARAYADQVFFSEVAPVAQEQGVWTLPAAAASVTLLATDANGDTLTYSIVKSPSHGSLSGTAPNVVYTPAAGFQGVDDFTFKASDGKSDSNAAKVVVHVGSATAGLLAESFHCASGMTTLPDLRGRTADLTQIVAQVNYVSDGDFPEGFAEAFASRHSGYLQIATAGSYTLYVNSDDGSKLWIDGTQALANDGVHGMTERSATLTLTAGLHALRLEYFQGNGGKGLVLNWAGPGITKAVVPASVLFHAGGSNTAPVAQGQTLVAAGSAPLAITLAATDVDEDPLVFALLTRPAHGTVFGVPPALSYQADAGFLGSDSFTFSASDGQADSSAATIAITVQAGNTPPVAEDQSLTIIQDKASALKLLASDADGNTLTYALLTQPAHGILSGTAPSLTYTPASGYAGNDAFTFRVSDGKASSNTATVRLYVGAVASGLQAEFFHWSGLSAVPVFGSRRADLSQVDAQINYGNGGFPSGFSTDFASRHSGFLKIDTAGSYTLYVKSDDGSKVFLDGAQLITNDGPHGAQERSQSVTLAVGYHALRVEYYQGASDNALVFSWAGPSIAKAVVPASVLFHVSVANAAPHAVDQNLAAQKNAALTVHLSATDGDGDPLVYTLLQQPPHGTLSGTAPDLLYQPAANFLGSESFSFQVSDGKADSNIATVTLTVSEAPVPPTITGQPQGVTVNEGQTATFKVTASGSALTYQWQRGGTAIAGATSAAYTTPVLSLADSGGAFRVVISNVGGTVTSSAATLTVSEVVLAPAILAQPADASVAVGKSATFSVTATGTRPAYQWQKLGASIAGATASTYTTPVTTAVDGGAAYSVVVSNSAGTVTSRSAALALIKSLDLNSDGTEDVLDLAALAASYGVSSAAADLNSSGLVDDADISLWFAGF